MLRLLRCQGIKTALSVLPLVALTSLLLVAAPLDITRTWKSSDGVYSVDAELVEAKDGKVSLRKRNGVVIEVPLARLSAEDQAYVAKYMEAGSFARDVNTEKGQATSPTWADQQPDPTYDDPEEQAIMLNRKRDPTHRLLDDYYRIQAEGAIQDLRKRKSAAIGQKNREARNRGIDTLQASSAMGDTEGAEERSRKYQEEMRQASENPRLAPTFGRMFDDPIGWLSATTGEYALLALFCGSIFAGVFFWISKQRSRHETQQNSEEGYARLVGKETFFWVREFQDYKVVYTYRNYKLFYFCILPLLIVLMVVPVIGWIPILGWIWYWSIYPRPNRELNQMLKEAQCVATGSKLSAVNPMRLTFSRTDFDRIVMRTEYTTPETTQSSNAPTLLSTYSDSSYSDTELESLKRNNEALKRKVEAKKLAEKLASDRAALEAENVRLMAELGEEIEKSQLSCEVHPSSVANKNLADRKISGVGGWLALLVVVMLVLGPLSSIFKTGSNIWIAEMQNPGLASVPQWLAFKIMTWCVVGAVVVYRIISGLLLLAKKEPLSVKNAIACLWIGGPAAAFVLGILIPWVSFGTAALEEVMPQSIGTIIGSIIAATIWTAYLRKSKRVRNTYFP